MDPAPRKFEPRTVEPARPERVKHELPRATKAPAPAPASALPPTPVPFVPPAVSASPVPPAAPVTAAPVPRPRAPKAAANPATAPTPPVASTPGSDSPVPTVPAAKASKVIPPHLTPRPNEAEAVDSKSPAAAPTVGITRLWISTGEEQGATADALREFILGTTGEPAASIGRIDIRERHTFVEVPGDRAASFVSRLKRAEFGGKRIKAKVA